MSNCDDYLSADLVAALASLDVHDFPHVVCELNKLLNTNNFFLLRTHHVLSWLLEE